MKKSRTSTYYYPYTCMQVYEAVTTNKGDGSYQYSPLSPAQEERTSVDNIPDGSVIATITDRTPGKSCGYKMTAPKFDVTWNATFSPAADNETKLTITETYTFHKGAIIPYLLFLMYGKQKDQHMIYFQSINKRLNQLYPKPGQKKAKPFTKIWKR